MEKILLAIDAQDPNMNAIDFGCYLARLKKASLTGIFLEDLLYNNKPVMKLLFGLPYVESITTDNLPDQEKRRVITEDNIRSFHQACGNRSVISKVHRDRGIPPEEIIEESRFADLVIIDPATSFSRNAEKSPGSFIQDILHEAECPVIISPYSFHQIDELYFTYNGSPSSVFAIKQFTYLFPELRNRKAVLLQVTEDQQGSQEDKYRLMEWMKLHYQNIEQVTLKGHAADQLFTWLIDKKNGIVVLGAFGRTMLSQFFKPSQARLIVKAVNLPIFIAHH